MHLKTVNNTYHYRRRIPKELSTHIRLSEFKRTLSKDKRAARVMAAGLDLLFERMLLSVQLDVDISTLVDELGLQDRTNKEDLYTVFLKTKCDVAKNTLAEYERQVAFFRAVLPDIGTLNYKDIDDVTAMIKKLPKRNIHKYKSIPIKEIITTKIPAEDLLSVKSQNEFLKTLRAILKLGIERDYFATAPEVKLLKNKTTARHQRQQLEKKEIQLLFNDPRTSDVAKLLYYSGMRLGELYKCSISTYDGILCFDLSDTSIALKNASSHRIIPIHPYIIKEVETMLEAVRKRTSNYHSKIGSSMFSEKTKSLYSLRHTFATDLAAAGVDIEVVGELMGHASAGMTRGRYIKGLSPKVLKEAIDKLQNTSLISSNTIA